MRSVETARPSHAILNRTSFPGNSSRLRISLDAEGLEQLLKEELRMSVLTTRHVRGRSGAKGHLTPKSMIHEMNVADVERKERRREQNRRAAQRCRRKKRMNQLSVLQNYEWVITHNQQLQQEVSHLRQDLSRVTSALKAHRNACTCTHVHKGPLHVQTTNVKVEPGENSPGPKKGEYKTPPPPPLPPPPSLPQPPSVPVSRCLAMSSCQYEASPVGSESSLAPERNSAALVSPERERNSMQMSSSLQMNGQHSSFYAGPMPERAPSYQSSPMQERAPSYQSSPRAPLQRNNQPCVSPHRGQVVPQTSPPNLPLPSPSCGSSLSYRQPGEESRGPVPPHYSLPDMQENPFGMRPSASLQDRPDCLQGEFRGPVPMAAFRPVRMDGAPQQQQQQTGGPHPEGTFGLLEDLAGLPGGLGSCVFQTEAATPLSADGRRSISSVSSDASGGSEPPPRCEGSRTETASGVLPGEFYVAEEIVSTNDLSQLLSQINQSDLLFHQEGRVEEVFPDHVTCLPPHFLHAL